MILFTIQYYLSLDDQYSIFFCQRDSNKEFKYLRLDAQYCGCRSDTQITTFCIIM